MLKTALISGCSSGFGLSMVKSLSVQGFRVIACYRTMSEELQKLSSHENVTVLQLDLSNRKELAEFSGKLPGLLKDKTLDLLINNAGYGQYGAFENISFAAVENQFQVNLFSAMQLTKACLPFLKKAKGRIIAVSSVNAIMPMPLATLYSASKAAMEGFYKGLFYELKPHNVQVSIIRPGAYPTSFSDSMHWADEVNTDDYEAQEKALKSFRQKLQSRKKKPEPEEISKVVLKLISKKKMPLVQVMGKDARFVNLLNSLLPESIYNRFLNLFYSKIFKGENDEKSNDIVAVKSSVR